MLLRIDGSRHQWLPDERWYDLIVILDVVQGAPSGAGQDSNLHLQA